MDLSLSDGIVNLVEVTHAQMATRSASFKDSLPSNEQVKCTRNELVNALAVAHEKIGSRSMKTKSLHRWCLAFGCMLALVASLSGASAQEAPGGRGRSGGWMGNGTGASPVTGSVTAVSAADLTIRTAEGDIYKVLFSVNTRFIKDRQPVKSGDVKAGDTVLAMGVLDAKAKTVAAALVAELDPEQAKKLHELQANYGKTWLAGKVSAIGDTKLTITGIDGKPANFVVDENTSFKKRRDSITLADIKVGDQVRVQGGVRSGTFFASTLNVFEPRSGGESDPHEGVIPGMGQPTAPQD